MLHWNQIPDFGDLGDIKLVWEGSRFTHIYTLMIVCHHDATYLPKVIQHIVDWIESNPFPYGPHYKCGQEISFRLMAWSLFLTTFSESIQKEDRNIIIKNIYASLQRIKGNISYATQAVKNNHSISEACGLIIPNLVLNFPESKAWVEKGGHILEKEIAYQEYGDGSYIQSSFNYQRLVLDTLSLLIHYSNHTNMSVPTAARAAHHRLGQFLYSFVQENGHLPNYGSNDGANLFPFTSSEYRNYKESINFAFSLHNHPALFEGHDELITFFRRQRNDATRPAPSTQFPKGGYYIFKNKESFVFTRAHTYTHRPCHNDMNHIDIWHKGVNIFHDAGSYSYNTDSDTKDFVLGNKGHNIITINGENQMQNALNFGFDNWAKSEVKTLSDNTITMTNKCYKKQFGVTLKRTVQFSPEKIEIVDHCYNPKQHTLTLSQNWNTLNDCTLDDHVATHKLWTLETSGKLEKHDGWVSSHYNEKEESSRLASEIKTQDKESTITTTITLQ